MAPASANRAFWDVLKFLLLRTGNALRSILDAQQRKRFEELLKRRRPAADFPGCEGCFDGEIEQGSILGAQ